MSVANAMAETSHGRVSAVGLASMQWQRCTVLMRDSSRERDAELEYREWAAVLCE